MSERVITRLYLCILSDYQFINEGYTFVSDAWGTSSWLDHCLTTEDAHKAITQVSILYDMVSSDHKPIILNVSVNNMPQCSLDRGTNDDENCSSSVKWGSVDKNSILLYHTNSRNLLGRLYESVSLQDVCLNRNCQGISHIRYIDDLYSSITEALIKFSDFLVRGSKRRTFVVPGWNENVKAVHEAARSALLMWHRAGKPRSEPIKCTRRIFN